MNRNSRSLVGGKIRQFRMRAGLTIEELAFRAGVHHNYLGDLERGNRNPSLANLEKIARGLKVSLRELFPKIPEKAARGESESIYESMRPLIKYLRDNSPEDRDHVIAVAESVARRLRKYRRK
ncbi:MAG: helix-turn-helix domain-containing protein [bacterium]